MSSPFTIGGLQVVSLNLVDQWGLAPASGSATAVGAGSVAEGSEVTFTVGGFTFSGIITDAVRSVDDGTLWTLTIVDFREKLKDDEVYGFFNRVEVIEDDPSTPGIDRKKRYVHLYPENWGTYTLTRTDEPHTAKEILQKVFAASTVRYTWSLTDHPNLRTKPQSIDFETGKQIGVVLQEIAEECGLIVGLADATTLRFAVQGEGNIPPFPADSRQRSIGQALADAPTKVNIVGDRNLYQVANIPLVADWKTGWQEWWGEMQWLAKVKLWFGPYPETKAGQAKLAADARKVTVRQAVQQSGDVALSDYGQWGEVSRMEIPAWLYLQEIVFKAYRVPRSLVINNTPLSSAQVHGELLRPVIYDPRSGKHVANADETNLYASTTAFVTCRGQPLDVWDPTRSGEFNPELLEKARTAWQSNQRFHLDEKNFVIVFEDAVFTDGEGVSALIIFPNQDVSDIDDDLRYLAVPNAQAEITAANCYASMVFQAERYAKSFGSGRRADTISQPGLARHVVAGVEIVYEDGESADEKATEMAEILLDRDQQIISGGYTRVGSAGTSLTGSISSVHVTVTFGEGVSEVVAFSSERGVLNWDSDRELERKRKSEELFPGQQRLKVEVDQLIQTSRYLRGASPHRSGYYDNMGDVSMRPTTNREANPRIAYRPTAAVTYQAGDCLFYDDDRTLGAEGTDFAGVVIPSNVTGNHVPLAVQGRVPVRVRGPFTSGSSVGVENYGEAGGSPTSCIPDGARPVGRVTRDYEGSDIIIVPVDLNASGTSAVREWKLSLAGEGKVKMFGGSLDGMGETNFTPDELTANAWTEFPVGATTWFYLRFQFDPVVSQRLFYTNHESENRVLYAVGSGHGGTVAMNLVTSNVEMSSQAPVVDPDTGVVETPADYYLLVATATLVGTVITARNRLSGPLAANFCAPGTLMVWEQSPVNVL